MMILHGSAVSVYTAKLRIALHTKGLAFVEREPEGGYRSAAWRERQPTGTIPALEVDGVLLAESEAVVEYLEDAHPTPRLLPGTPLQRAQARFLARYHDLHLEPRVRALFPLVRPPIPEFTVLGGMMVDRTDINHLLAMGRSLRSLLPMPSPLP